MNMQRNCWASIPAFTNPTLCVNTGFLFKVGYLRVIRPVLKAKSPLGDEVIVVLTEGHEGVTFRDLWSFICPWGEPHLSVNHAHAWLACEWFPLLFYLYRSMLRTKPNNFPPDPCSLFWFWRWPVIVLIYLLRKSHPSTFGSTYFLFGLLLHCFCFLTVKPIECFVSRRNDGSSRNNNS